MARLLNLLLGPHRFSTESPWGLMTGICAIFGAVILSLVLIIAVGVGLAIVLPGNSLACVTGGETLMAPGCARWLLGLSGGLFLAILVSFYALAHARKNGNPANVLLLRPSGLSWLQYVLVIVAMFIVAHASLYIIATVTGASEA